jgi:hypothetical protein
LNDSDNFLYEISGEAPVASRDWQYYMINYFKNDEATKSKQHCVGMSDWYLGVSMTCWRARPIGFWCQALIRILRCQQSTKLSPRIWIRNSSGAARLTRNSARFYLESDLPNPGADEKVRDCMAYTLKYSHILDLSSAWIPAHPRGLPTVIASKRLIVRGLYLTPMRRVPPLRFRASPNSILTATRGLIANNFLCKIGCVFARILIAVPDSPRKEILPLCKCTGSSSEPPSSFALW